MPARRPEPNQSQAPAFPKTKASPPPAMDASANRSPQPRSSSPKPPPPPHPKSQARDGGKGNMPPGAMETPAPAHNPDMQSSCERSVPKSISPPPKQRLGQCP